jgi:hypothetical protein
MTTLVTRMDGRFLWDMKAPNNDPELFARQYCDDLQLPSDCTALVAHSIRHRPAVHQSPFFVLAKHQVQLGGCHASSIAFDMLCTLVLLAMLLKACMHAGA